MSAHGYEVACGRLEAAADRLLAQPERDADNARFVRTLLKQCPRLFTFLYHNAVDPTNNAAERELRPAVAVRKTGGCNRTGVGAHAHAILASIFRTCLKQGFDPVEVLKHLLHSAETLILDLAAPPKTGRLRPPAIASSSKSPVNKYAGLYPTCLASRLPAAPGEHGQGDDLDEGD
jgi:hypothetical protein